MKKWIIFSLVVSALTSSSQTISAVYKINGLLNRIKSDDTLYVVNFWATWCKPCIAELPAFDSLYEKTRGTKVKIILVNLDFKEVLDEKVNPFLQRNKLRSECVLLDEVNGNEFIDKVSDRWSGAIPATLFKLGTIKFLVEKKQHLGNLEEQIKKISS